MIRFFRAFLWLRWRLFRNSLRGRSDTAAKLARWGQAILRVVLPLLFVPAALGLGILAFLAGGHMGGGGENPRSVIVAARVALGAVTIAVILAPLLRSIHGSTTGRARFLLLPIPRSALHLCEMAAGLSDPWIFGLIPALFLLPLGWFFRGSGLEALLMLAAGLAVLATLLVLSALAAFGSALLFRNRKRAETISLVLLLLITGLSFIPLFLDGTFGNKKDRETGIRLQVEKSKRYLAPLSWVAPSELYAKTLHGARTGKLVGGLAPLGLSLLVGSLLFAGSAKLHRRLLDTPAVSSGGRTDGKPLRFSMPRFPLLGSPASALAWATVRMALRTVKGKLSFYAIPLGVAAFGFMLSRQWEGKELLGIPIDAGTALAFLALIFPLLSMQSVSLNLYAIDRAGLTLSFLAPLSDDELARGKIAGGALLTGGCTLLSLAVAALVTRGGTVSFWLMMALGGVATNLILAPVFAMLSAIFPKTADLTELGSRGNPNQIAALIGTLLTTALMTPVAILALAGQFLFGSWLGGLGLMAAWVVIAALVCVPLLHLAAGILGKRRENLALVAQGR